MAFVEVVRRSLRPEEWTDLRYGYLKRGIIRDREEITPVLVRDRVQTGENEYVDISDWRNLSKDDVYFTPDGNVVIKAKGTVPERLRNGDVYLYLHTAAEMIVRVNGRYAGGIDPNRDRLLLNPFLGDDWSADIEIEGYNRSKPDDERNPDAMSDRGCRQIFHGMYFAAVNEDVLNLFYDLTALIDIEKSRHFDEDLRAFLTKELDRALNLVDFETYEGADRARKYIEDVIYSNTDFRSSGSVALISHSHLDIAYYWRRIHTVQKNARTVLIQMRLMDKYSDFTYCHTQPYIYETLEKYYPEIFAELKEKVAEGRFEPVGAMYVEPDCNIPSAESLIRQCLYGQKYYEKTFGKRVDSAWLPDVFGNSWILPQILKKSGVDYFVSNKMSTWNDTNRFPHNSFMWKGIDGTKIAASVPPTHFITWNMPSQIKENWDAYIDKEEGGDTLSMFGYGDGGSGATEEMIELMHRFDRISAMPKTEHMRADEYLHRNLKDNDKLETWDGELYLEMHRGTFTTKSVLKRYNRKLEFMLRDAEILSVIRYLSGQEYPKEKLDEAYKTLLLNQFHDILPGSHINPVYQDAIRDYEKTEAIVSSVIDEKGDWLFNTLSHDRKEPVFIESAEGSQIRKGVKGYWTNVEVKALSSVKAGAAPSPDTSWIKVDGMNVSTPFNEISFAPDASIVSLKDKKGREYSAKGLNRYHLYQDMPGMYDSWDILPNYRDVEYDLEVASPLSFVYADSVCALFEAELKTPGGKSTLKLKVRLFSSSPLIECELDASWHEKHRLLKAAFSTPFISRELVCDTSAGFIKRETHRNTTWQKARFEVCSHKWCDFAQSDRGLAVINEGKYGLSPEEDGFALSLLRANIRPDIDSDMGEHTIVYGILPHEGSFLDARVNEKAYCFNSPLVRQPSHLSFTNPFPGLVLQAMKLSEDGKKIVFRLLEADGKGGVLKTDGAYEVMNMLEDTLDKPMTYQYHPFEIITLAKEIR